MVKLKFIFISILLMLSIQGCGKFNNLVGFKFNDSDKSPKILTNAGSIMLIDSGSYIVNDDTSTSCLGGANTGMLDQATLTRGCMQPPAVEVTDSGEWVVSFTQNYLGFNSGAPPMVVGFSLFATISNALTGAFGGLGTGLGVISPGGSLVNPATQSSRYVRFAKMSNGDIASVYWVDNITERTVFASVYKKSLKTWSGATRLGTAAIPTDFGSDFAGSTGNFRAQFCRPTIAASGDGSAMAAWCEGANSQIKVAKYSAGVWAATTDLFSAGATDPAVPGFYADARTMGAAITVNDVFLGNLTVGTKVYSSTITAVNTLAGSAQFQIVRDNADNIMMCDTLRNLATAFVSTTVSTGALIYKETKFDGVAGVDGLNGASSVAVTPDGLFVYVASDTDDSVAIFRRNTITGSLTYLTRVVDGVAGVDGLDGANFVIVSPDGAHLYVSGRDEDKVALFTRNTVTGLLTFVAIQQDGVGGVTSLDQPTSIAITADGATVYVSSFVDDAVVVFSRNSATGVLTLVEEEIDGVAGVTGLDGATSVFVDPTGNHVYATGQNDNAIQAFTRNTTTGVIAPLEAHVDGASGVDGLSAATSVTVSPDSKHVYLTGAGADNAVSLFLRETDTTSANFGKLTFIEVKKDTDVGTDGLAGASFVLVNPDGKYVYVSGATDDSIAVFSRDLNTGVLTFSQFKDDGVEGVNGLDGASGIATSGNGQSIYVAGQADDAITLFDRESTTTTNLSTLGVSMKVDPNCTNGSNIATPTAAEIATWNITTYFNRSQTNIIRDRTVAAADYMVNRDPATAAIGLKKNGVALAANATGLGSFENINGMIRSGLVDIAGDGVGNYALVRSVPSPVFLTANITSTSVLNARLLVGHEYTPALGWTTSGSYIKTSLVSQIPACFNGTEYSECSVKNPKFLMTSAGQGLVLFYQNQLSPIPSTGVAFPNRLNVATYSASSGYSLRSNPIDTDEMCSSTSFANDTSVCETASYSATGRCQTQSEASMQSVPATTISHDIPAIPAAMNAQGYAIIGYHKKKNLGTLAEPTCTYVSAYAAQYDPISGFSAATQLDDNLGDTMHMSVNINSKGTAAAAWEQIVDGLVYIYVRRYMGSWSAKEIVNTSQYSPTDSMMPSVSVNENDEVLVTYTYSVGGVRRQFARTLFLKN